MTKSSMAALLTATVMLSGMTSGAALARGLNAPMSSAGSQTIGVADGETYPQFSIPGQDGQPHAYAQAAPNTPDQQDDQRA